MRIQLVWATAIFTAALSGVPLNAARQVDPRSGVTEEALGGLDPVRLVQGQEVDGKDNLSVAYHGLIYYFATAETKATFEKEPRRYAVQLDGLCARMGAPVLGSQSLYAVHDGRIYVFGSPECQKRFVADAARYLDRSPSPLADLSPTAMAKGRTLLDRAVKATGGAAALSAVSGFREKTTREITTMQGKSEAKLDTTALLPNRWRQESSNQYGQFLIVVTPEAAFRATSRSEPRPLNDALRSYYMSQLGSHPLALLRAYVGQAVRVGALDPIVDRGITLDRVAVEHDGASIVLTLDASGRIVGLTSRGRHPREGVIADIAQTLSDYRPVGSLSLPFRVDTRVDGAESTDLSYSVESIELNPAIDTTALVRPLEARP